MLQNVTDDPVSLTDRQFQALPYVAGARTLSDGAKLAQISRATLYRWMEDDDFRNEVRRLRNEAAEFAYLELKGLALKAALVLGDAMEDPNPSVRLQAARIALTFSLKANETKDMEKRLDLMEDALPLWTKRNMRW